MYSTVAHHLSITTRLLDFGDRLAGLKAELFRRNL